MKKFFLLILAVYAVWMVFAFQKDGKRAELLRADIVAQNPTDFAHDTFDSTYKVRSNIYNGNELEVVLSGPSLTAGTTTSVFNVEVANLVPTIFSSFPKVNNVSMVRVVTGKDIRGNDGSAAAIRLSFSRVNASSIQWKSISFSDVPKLADTYWNNPNLAN